jgi:hypothetical protein
MNTSQTKVPETMVISIHKTPVMVMEVTGIISRTTGTMKMSLDVTIIDIIMAEEIWGEINMIIQATIIDNLKIIHIGTATETQGAIRCIVMIEEIYNLTPLTKPRNCGVFHVINSIKSYAPVRGTRNGIRKIEHSLYLDEHEVTCF